MKIYDLSGKRVPEKRFTLSSFLTINHSEINLGKGMYIIELLFAHGSEKKKLIVE